MDNNDRQAIEGLFSKLGTLERDMPQRDAEAERFIAEQVSRQPGAPYYMAQTIVMQQMALENQQREMEALRAQADSGRYASSQGGGGFLSRMFGGGEPQRAAPAAAPRGMGAPGAAAGPWGAQGRVGMPGGQPGMAGQPGMMGGRGGGGFLAGAAQTAMGVAGGVLLGNAIAGMFDGGEAQAAEAGAPAEEPAMEQTADEGGFFDDGGGFDEEI
ncbi:DUF2076 domain-containing protein [Aureimonas sp. SK2]|uniref:DUF2076 domain-containing protein n=1 Tax=Aureimonas sp. SK2 TaxID=3015992 RepID=UPI002443781E|nr:DUF2076 domain-containing protein [Aureimonas sp. SK2]